MIGVISSVPSSSFSNSCQEVIDEETPLLVASNIEELLATDSSSNIMNNNLSLGMNYESASRTGQDFPPVNSKGSSALGRPKYPEGYRLPASRLGPQRTSYTTQKLKLLPDEPITEDQENGKEVYSQVTRIKEIPARKDAERLGKAHRAMLPRVTAYCTASSYRIKDLAKYLSSRKGHGALPKMFDECLYTPYSYKRPASFRGSVNESIPEISNSTPGLIRLDDEGGEIDVEVTGKCDVFLFEYGVVVLWGFTESEERGFLKEIVKFENEKLASGDLQVEEFNYYITKSYQPRVSCYVIF